MADENDPILPDDELEATDADLGEEAAEVFDGAAADEPGPVAEPADPVVEPATDPGPAPAATATISPARFPPILEEGPDEPHEDRNLELLMDVTVPITAEIGRTEMALADVLRLGPGSVVELDKSADEPVEILVNGKLLATGEVVVVGDRFGVRILDVVERGE